MQVFKVDNSLAVRLPQETIDELGLKEGDEVALVVARKDKTETESKDERRRQAVEQLASLKWPLPPDYKFDRDEANAR
jgi:antitoxin MazE